MANTPNLAMPLLTEAQANGEVTHNDALNHLDAQVHLSFIEFDAETPPGGPANGDTYELGVTPTGVWVGQAEEVAFYYDGWIFVTPEEGWSAYDRVPNRMLYHNGTDWLPQQLGTSTHPKTGASTLTVDENVLLVDATGGSFTLTLPTAIIGMQKIYEFVKINAANSVTIKGDGAELINAANTFVISTQFNTLRIISDNVQWWILQKI